MTKELSSKNLQTRVRLNQSRIRTKAEKFLKREGIRSYTLSLVFVSDRKIQSLNRRYLKRDRPTDVLAFALDLHEGARTSAGKVSGRPRSLSGEIVISADTAKRNARRFGTSLQDELLLYVIHGLLHLIGYDDRSPAQAGRMRLKEQEVMDDLISRRPDP